MRASGVVSSAGGRHESDQDEGGDVRRAKHTGATLSIVALILSAADAGAQRRGERRTHDFRQPVGLDKVFYDMAREVPGFAGFVIDSTGTFVISLTDPAAHGDAAIEVVRRYLERSGRRAGIRVGPPVDYDFRQLYDWMAKYAMSPPSVGLTSFGVWEGRNRVCVGIRPGRSIARAYEKADLLGIPRAALVVREEPVIVLTPKRDST